MAEGNGTTLIGPPTDDLFGPPAPARARPEVEYLAGGTRDFPLAGQVLLAQSCDDLERDLGDLVYEAMFHDPTAKAGVMALWAGILDGNLRIRPRVRPDPAEEPDPASDRGRSIALSAAVHAFWGRCLADLRPGPEAQPRAVEEVSLEFLEGMVYGTKLAEKVFAPGAGPDAGRLVLRDLAFKPRRNWQFLATRTGRVVAIRGLQPDGGWVDLPPQKCALFTWMPRDGDPRGRSLLRGSYNGWNLKVSTWPKLFKYLDRFGTPIVVGTAARDAPPEPDKDDAGRPTGRVLDGTEALGRALGRLEGGSWVAIREGSTIAIYEPTGNGEAFLAGIQIFKREMLEGILTTSRAILEAEHGSKVDTDAAHDNLVARLIGLGRTALRQTWDSILRHGTEIQPEWGPAVARDHTPEVDLGVVTAADVAKVVQAFGSAGGDGRWGPAPEHFPEIDALVGLTPRRRVDIPGQGQGQGQGRPQPRGPEQAP